MPKAIISPSARQDLLDIWEFIARDNMDAADRVREAAFRSFEHLAGMPEIGTVRPFKNPVLLDLRFWPIPGFSTVSYLLPLQNQIGLRSFGCSTARVI